MFRAAQEALYQRWPSNAQGDQGADDLLTYLDDTLLLDVADDGTGFNASAATGGYGLVGMQQRLSRVGGTLTVESSPGSGTILNASVPLAGPGEGASR